MNYFNQYMPTNNVYAYVNGIEGAKSYQVPANQTVLLIDNDNPYIYMKTANALGQATMRYFKIEEVEGFKSDNDYITRKELMELLGGKTNESNESK